MSLCEGARTRFRVDAELAEEFETRVMMQKRFCCRSEGCSLHAVALLDSIWIDKWHQFSLPTGKWAQLPFLGQPATGTSSVAGTTHTESGRR